MQVLPSILDLLKSSQDTAGRAKNIKLCNAKSRIAILQSLVRLYDDDPSENERPSDDGSLHTLHPEESLVLARRTPTEAYLVDQVAKAADGAADSTLALGQFVERINTPLLAIWSECASSEQPSADEATCMALVLQLLALLYKSLSDNVAKTVLLAVLPQTQMNILMHFPFTQLGKASDGNSLNVRACQIMSHCLRATDSGQEFGANSWMNRVFTFLVNSLEGSSEMNAAALPQGEIKTLLDSLGRFLKHLSVPSCIEAGFKSVLVLTKRCHSQSVSRRACIAFMACWLAGREVHMQQDVSTALVTEWLKCLPKALWELKSDHLDTSRVIISTLLDFARRAPASTASLKAFSNTQESLVPFFFTVVFAKKAIRKIYGPFVIMPEDVQRRALDVLCYFPGLSVPMLRAVAACCVNTSVADSVCVYAINVVHSVRTRIPAEDYISFMMSILLHDSSPLVQTHICACMLHLHAGATIAPLVTPVLEKVMTQDPPMSILLGVCKCVAVCAQSAAEQTGQSGDMFPQVFHSKIAKLLWSILKLTHPSSQQPQALDMGTSHSKELIPGCIVTIIKHLPVAWPLLLDHIGREVCTCTQANDAVMILSSLVSELARLPIIRECAAKLQEVILCIQNTSGKDQHTDRLLALIELHGASACQLSNMTATC